MVLFGLFSDLVLLFMVKYLFVKFFVRGNNSELVSRKNERTRSPATRTPPTPKTDAMQRQVRRPDDDTTRSSPTPEMRHVLHLCFVPAGFVRAVIWSPTPDHREPRRPPSPERQGPPRQRREYDYLPDVDYLEYFDSGWMTTSTTSAPNPKIPRTWCVTPTLTLYHICVSYKIMHA